MLPFLSFYAISTTVHPPEDSRQLLRLFREQIPRTPSLPPIVIEPLVVNAVNDEVVDVPELILEQESSLSNENALFGSSNSRENCRNTCQENSYNYGRGPENVGVVGVPPSPPLPRFERSMMIEAVLTVPRADYSEPYVLWYVLTIVI